VFELHGSLASPSAAQLPESVLQNSPSPQRLSFVQGSPTPLSGRQLLSAAQ
jgi:hypothetical protein